MAQNSAFRPNVYPVDTSGNGSVVNLSILNAAGAVIASLANVPLDAWEPLYMTTSGDFGAPNFDAGTLHMEVVSGAAVVVAAKVDNDPATGDPTTLEPWWMQEEGGGGGECGGDGIYTGLTSYTYEGGLLMSVTGDAIDLIQGALVLFSPDDGGSNCANVFGYGIELDTPVAFDSQGNFTATFDLEYSSGMILAFTFDGTKDGDTILGTVDINVSGGGMTDCDGDMTQVPFYAGHTLLTFGK